MSSSSSEYLCSECINHTAAYRSPSFRTRAPYYQNLGRPLIYYAQVQPANRRPRSRDARKGSPNCFVKAFRWYTQDHYPQRNHHLPSDRTDLSGFAMWLDKKYDEFILDQHAEQELFQGQPKQPGEFEAEILGSCTELDPYEKKSLASRLKSPFMKRRRHPTECSKESGDTPDKCNQSLEYILKPKELSRPVSDCSHVIPSTENSKKTVKMKAHSSDTTTVHEKSGIVPLSGINYIDESKEKRDGSDPKKPEIKAIEYQKIVSENVGIGIKSLKDVSCQGPEGTLVSADAPVQCDISCKNETWTNIPVPRYSCCPACSFKDQSEHSAGPSQSREYDSKMKTPEISKRVSNTKELKSETTSCACFEPAPRKKDLHVQHSKDDKIECYCTVKDNFESTYQPSVQQVSEPEPVPIVVQCPCPTPLRPASAMRAPTVMWHQSIALDPKPLKIHDMETEITVIPPPPKIRFDSVEAQTSDHPICLETEHGYPLFMKIICADKLYEECKSRK